MLKTISSSDLRARIKRVLNEVEYGQAEYIVEKFGEPAVAIVNMADFLLLRALRRQKPGKELREVVERIRMRITPQDAEDLDPLIEQARSEFYQLRSGQADGD